MGDDKLVFRMSILDGLLALPGHYNDIHIGLLQLRCILNRAETGYSGRREVTMSCLPMDCCEQEKKRRRDGFATRFSLRSAKSLA